MCQNYTQKSNHVKSSDINPDRGHKINQNLNQLKESLSLSPYSHATGAQLIRVFSLRDIRSQNPQIPNQLSQIPAGYSR